MCPTRLMWTGVTSLPPRDFLLRTTMLINPPPLRTAFTTCFLSLLVRSMSLIFNNQSFTLKTRKRGWMMWHLINSRKGHRKAYWGSSYLNLPSAILPLSTLVTNIPQSPGKYGSFTPSAISNPSAFKSMSSCKGNNTNVSKCIHFDKLISISSSFGSL